MCGRRGRKHIVGTLYRHFSILDVFVYSARLCCKLTSIFVTEVTTMIVTILVTIVGYGTTILNILLIVWIVHL